MSNKTRTLGLAAGIIILYTTPSVIIQAQAVPMSVTPTSTATSTAQTTVATVATNISAVAGPEILHLKVTAYASVPDQTDDTPFITANGDTVHDGIVATNLLPFGTKVTIPSLFGDKVFTVDDRMNKRFSKNIDVWMSSTAAAIVFGAHMADILVVPGQDVDLSLLTAGSK